MSESLRTKALDLRARCGTLSRRYERLSSLNSPKADMVKRQLSISLAALKKVEREIEKAPRNRNYLER